MDGRVMPLLTPAVLRLMLGALFVSTFFENLEKNLYTSSGYAGLIDDYAARNHAPGVWSDHFMPFISDHASFFAPVQAAFELSLGILLVLGIASGIVALVTAAHLTALWISELGIFWVWELLGLIVVAVLVGLAYLPSLLDRSRPVRDRVLGPPSLGAMGTGGRVLLAVGLGAALAGVNLAARTGGEAHYQQVAWESGLAYGVLVLLFGLLDRRRVS